MDLNEKAMFIAQSLSKQFKKQNATDRAKSGKFIKQLEQKIKRNMDIDFDEIFNALTESVSVMMASYEEFENTPQSKLEGLSIREYINSIDKLEHMLYIAMAINGEEDGAYPSSFVNKMKELPESELSRLKEYILAAEESANGVLNSEQIAIVHLCGLNGNEAFAVPLADMLKKLVQEAAEGEIKAICDALVGIGSHSVDPLIDIVKNSEPEGLKYEYVIRTLGTIGMNYRKEDIFLFLKDLFRRSKNKLSEAEALAMLDDGRIIPAIRGHIERNLDSMDPSVYERFREIVTDLGGDISDLDEFFDDPEDFGDFED